MLRMLLLFLSLSVCCGAAAQSEDAAKRAADELVAFINKLPPRDVTLGSERCQVQRYSARHLEALGKVRVDVEVETRCPSGAKMSTTEYLLTDIDSALIKPGPLGPSVCHVSCKGGDSCITLRFQGVQRLRVVMTQTLELCSAFQKAISALAPSPRPAPGGIEIVATKWGDSWGRSCTQWPGNPPRIGAPFSVYVKDWHTLTDNAGLQRLLDDLREEGVRRCPTGGLVAGEFRQKGVWGETIISAEWSRTTGEWTINRGKLAALLKEEQERAAAEKAAKERAEREARERQEAAAAKRAARAKFVFDFKIEEWANQQKLEANVFIYKDKVVGVQASFEQMTSATEARFGKLLVIDVPTAEFTTPREPMILAVKMMGLKPARIFGMEVELPYGRYVGVYRCKQSNCEDFFD